MLLENGTCNIIALYYVEFKEILRVWSLHMAGLVMAEVFLRMIYEKDKIDCIQDILFTALMQ